MSRNPYFCPDCFFTDYSRKSDTEILDMWAEWDAERDTKIAAAARHRAAVAQPDPEPEPEASCPAFTSTYAADERAAVAARADRRARIAEENAERKRLDGLIWAAGLSTEIQPRELSTSPLLAAAVERIAVERMDAGLSGVDPAASSVAIRIRRESIAAGIAARESMVAAAPEPVRVAVKQQIRQSDRAAGRELAYIERK